LTPLKVGIIGGGFYAAAALIPGLRATGRAEVVAVARRHGERLALIQKELQIPQGFADWRVMLEAVELDAVVVCIPNAYHAEAAITALQRGLHVFVEKPLALTHLESQSIIAAAEQANRIVTVGYNTRGMGSWRKVRQLLTEGAIGQLRQINALCALDGRLLWQNGSVDPALEGFMASSPLFDALLGDALRPRTWRSNYEISGGMFVEVGTHLLDLLLWLANATASAVVAWRQPHSDPFATAINAHVTLANQVALSLTFNDAVDYGDFNFRGYGHLTFIGDKGVLMAEWNRYMAAEAQTIWLERGGIREEVEAQPTDTAATTPIAAFVASVLDGLPNLAPAAEAAQAVALTEAISASIAQNQRIYLV
jgi:predicted dehydrogenase